ncbi:helix-turn-helix domain-containing protein [uncultured Sphingomonas sp.]|uniref:helix-turn-helix domain-containing protein n=1 Tax=uncultured Sphingomonas sp. TaxID=158754 RepID=UPI0035CB7E8E
MMTVLSISHNELSRFDTLQRVEQRELSAEDAAVLLGVSRRQVFRMLAAMRERGAEGLVSSKRGRPSNRRLSPARTDTAIALVREHYHDFGPTFAAEKLEEQHGIRISHDTLRKLMIEAGLWTTRQAQRLPL